MTKYLIQYGSPLIDPEGTYWYWGIPSATRPLTFHTVWLSGETREVAAGGWFTNLIEEAFEFDSEDEADLCAAEMILSMGFHPGSLRAVPKPETPRDKDIAPGAFS